ncbi:DUF2975 domain-containing protein [Parabacteroides chinchillae]
MKKQLNIICILIFVCLGLSLIPNVYMIGDSFVQGFKHGYSQSKEASLHLEKPQILMPLELSLWPESVAIAPDTIVNQKSGERFPVQHIHNIVWVDQAKSDTTTTRGLLSIIRLIAILYAIIQFYKLINAINHQVIFEWVNVKKLNKIGVALLLSYVMTMLFVGLNYLFAKSLIEIPGYHFNYWCELNTVNLILGLIALLVGRVFAMGITLREEQELTI